MKLASLRALFASAIELRTVADKKRQRGFTLVTSTISILVAGVVLGGTWLSYSMMQSQWRVASAERMMDQYAATTMQELTNRLSWAWGAKMIQGGPRNPKWAFYMDDVIEENGLFASTFPYTLGPDNALELTYRPTQGILFNAFPPKWAAERNSTHYVWSGRSGAPLGVVRSFDRRDRIDDAL